MTVWRPSKIIKWVEAFKEVIEDSYNALLCTDEELIMLVNEKLPEWEQIHESSFQKWKAWRVSEENQDVYQEFLRLYKKALIRERKSLMIKFQSDEWQWQKWAWIIERKFDEWNIRMKSEVDTNLKGELNIATLLWQIQDKN